MNHNQLNNILKILKICCFSIILYSCNQDKTINLKKVIKNDSDSIKFYLLNYNLLYGNFDKDIKLDTNVIVNFIFTKKPNYKVIYDFGNDILGNRTKFIPYCYEPIFVKLNARSKLAFNIQLNNKKISNKINGKYKLYINFKYFFECKKNKNQFIYINNLSEFNLKINENSIETNLPKCENINHDKLQKLNLNNELIEFTFN